MARSSASELGFYRPSKEAFHERLGKRHNFQHPFQVIGRIDDKSAGAWRPSPGSVYPTIQQLQDEGLVESDETHGRRTVRLTAAGVTYAEEQADELAAVWAPFEKAKFDGS